MPRVKRILQQKGPEVMSIGRNASVLDAAIMMNEHKIGALVVLDAGRVAGIITERDVLQRVVAARKDAAHIEVQSVMTTEVACCRADTQIDEARSIMKHKRIRHLPVVDDARRLVGLISIGDLNAFEINGHEITIQYLHQYLYGEMV